MCNVGMRPGPGLRNTVLEQDDMYMTLCVCKTFSLVCDLEMSVCSISVLAHGCESLSCTEVFSWSGQDWLSVLLLRSFKGSTAHRFISADLFFTDWSLWTIFQTFFFSGKILIWRYLDTEMASDRHVPYFCSLDSFCWNSLICVSSLQNSIYLHFRLLD